TLADREDNVHRVLAYDRCQDAAFWRDDVSLRDLGPADISCNWRFDVGIAEIDFCRFQVCYIGQDVSRGLFIIGQRLVSFLRRSITRSQEFTSAVEFNLGKLLRRFAPVEGALRLLYGGFEMVLLDAVKRLPGFDECPFCK